MGAHWKWWAPTDQVGCPLRHLLTPLRSKGAHIRFHLRGRCPRLPEVEERGFMTDYAVPLTKERQSPNLSPRSPQSSLTYQNQVLGQRTLMTP